LCVCVCVSVSVCVCVSHGHGHSNACSRSHAHTESMQERKRERARENRERREGSFGRGGGGGREGFSLPCSLSLLVCSPRLLAVSLTRARVLSLVHALPLAFGRSPTLPSLHTHKYRTMGRQKNIIGARSSWRLSMSRPSVTMV